MNAKEPQEFIERSGSNGRAPVVLAANGVTKSYGDTEVLHGIDLRIHQGEYVALVGESGSGKSTLMNILGTLELPTAGDVYLGGVAISTLSDKELSRLRAENLGFVFQSFHLLDGRSALENVADGLQYLDVPDEERRARAREALIRVGLSHRLNHVPHQLSGGEKQRVAIARALVADPWVIMADEPTGSLDSASSAAINQLLAQLHGEGVTIVLITHDPSSAEACPREVRIRDGRIAHDITRTASAGAEATKSNVVKNVPAASVAEPRHLNGDEHDDELENEPAPAKNRLRQAREQVRSAVPSLAQVRTTTKIAMWAIWAKPMRAALSALGIALGITAMVTVLGLGRASQAHMLEGLSKLGTNMLSIEASSNFGQEVELLPRAEGMIRRIAPVTNVGAVYQVDEQVYRNNLIAKNLTGAITVRSIDTETLTAIGASMAQGSLPDSQNAEVPVVALGPSAAKQLGFTGSVLGKKIWMADRWFTVIGLTQDLDLGGDLGRSVYVSHAYAVRYLGASQNPKRFYVRTDPEHVDAVAAVLAATVDPRRPDQVKVSRPSDAVEAQALAQGAFSGLFVGLGLVALIVGGVGVANVLVMSVVERRQEIGLRRALGATRANIREQFLSEAVTLSVLGGLAGILLAILATFGYSLAKGWPLVLMGQVWALALLAAVLIGAAAGVYPAVKASRMSPTQALRSAA